MAHVFEIDGKSYDIAYNIKRIEMYENMFGSIIASVSNSGAFSVPQLRGLIGYGLRFEGGSWVNPKHGMEMAYGLIEEYGYPELSSAVIEALERDCPFFFQGISND